MCQDENGGFRPVQGHDPHLLNTLSAVQVILQYGSGVFIFHPDALLPSFHHQKYPPSLSRNPVISVYRFLILEFRILTVGRMQDFILNKRT